MLHQYLRKKKKVLRGAMRTYLRSRPVPFTSKQWWDSHYWTTGVSDAKTIAPNKNGFSSAYHYASVELTILRHFYNHDVSLEGSAVFDVGSGAGHWVDFYRRLGAATCVGCDLSRTVVDFLRSKYAGQDGITIHHGPFQDILQGQRDAFDLVNAIGVMFHVVDDGEWRRGLSAIGEALRDGGLLVVGGHFGWLNNLDVQIDSTGAINKRLRSRRYWNKSLKSLGFRSVDVRSNPAYLFIDDTLPENNVLIARK